VYHPKLAPTSTTRGGLLPGGPALQRSLSTVWNTCGPACSVNDAAVLLLQAVCHQVCITAAQTSALAHVAQSADLFGFLAWLAHRCDLHLVRRVQHGAGGVAAQ
jgi:hypothetical protein